MRYRLPAPFYVLPFTGLLACLGPDDQRLDLGVDAAAPGDAATPDAVSSEDAEVSDAGSVDAASPDASPLDGAGPDATTTDAALVEVTVLNGANDVFAAGTGAISFFGASRFLASTSTTVEVYGVGDGRPDGTYVPLVLTSTQFGGNAAGAISTYSTGAVDLAFYLPTGVPQVGVIDLAPPGSLLHEAGLASPLAGGFSADLAVQGDLLFVSDAPFGADSMVRAYDLTGYSGAGSLVESTARRFVLPTSDLDGDSSDELLVAGRLAFSPDGAVGLVAFTVLGNSAPALAGGVLAFDPQTGQERGRVLVPTAGSSTVAQGFVGGLAITTTHLYVVTAEKQLVPSFAELGGHLSVYEITSWSPFRVRDLDNTAPYDQPLHQLGTSDDNPVGLAIIDDVVMVVNAPFFLDGTLDVFELGAAPALRQSSALGGLYVTGFAVPADPVRVPGTRQFLLATEAGTLRFEVAPR